MFDFAGKAALISGAAGGIGRATAEYFFNCGASVALVDIDKSVHAVAASLDGSGKRAIGIDHDSSRSEHATAAVKACIAAYGRLDYLVVCHAIYPKMESLEVSDDDWRRAMAINLDGVFYLCREAGKVMQDGAAIVTIASTAALEGAWGGRAHYGASKGGVISLTRTLARAYGPRIRVNAIAPGPIETPMIADVMHILEQRLKETSPLRRAGKPGEIASVAGFLCSEAASFVTGECIIASGGMYIG